MYERITPDGIRHGGRWYMNGDFVMLDVSCIVPSDTIVGFGMKHRYTATPSELTLYTDYADGKTVTVQTFARR
jgi:hypothetical protein